MSQKRYIAAEEIKEGAALVIKDGLAWRAPPSKPVRVAKRTRISRAISAMQKPGRAHEL